MGADQALITVGVVSEEVVSAAFDAIRKRGTIVITGLNGPQHKTVHVSGGLLTLFEKRIHGALFGSGTPFDDIPRLLGLYKSGKLKLDELITARYTPRPGQPGLRGHAGRPQHPRRHHPRALRILGRQSWSVR